MSAGQGPLFFYNRRVDEYSEEKATTVPLFGGMLDGIDFDMCHYVFEPGDMLVVPSDGLWQVEDRRGRMLRIAGFHRILGTCRAGPASDVIATVRRSVAEFAKNRKQADDQTTLVVRKSMLP